MVLAKLLIEKGAQLESEDGQGRRPFWLAVANGHEAMMKLLLGKGAQPKSEDGEGAKHRSGWFLLES